MSDTLSIVVPAYNEEEAIEGVVRSCLKASGSIREKGGVGRVEVIVVNDGSTDRTSEIVSHLAGQIAVGDERVRPVRVIRHERNMGYGAALVTGFREAKGDILGFLDGDGTCEAAAFGPLVERLRAATPYKADMVIGMRLGAGTAMPLVRRIGNRFFAAALRLLSGRRIRDTASGQRVFRRGLLPALLKGNGLPPGLDFTPAMSARVAFDRSLSFAEVAVPYGEREGRSKLGVVRDGLRFLRAILDAALSYRPGPFFYLAATVLWGFALGYGLPAVIAYARTRTVPEWMIYRLLTVLAAGIGGQVFFLAGTAAQRIAHTVHGLPPPGFRGIAGLAKRAVAALPGTRAILLVLASAALLVKPGIEYLRTGEVWFHWSRILTGLFLFLAGLVYAAHFIENRMISLWERSRGRGAPPGPPTERTTERTERTEKSGNGTARRP